MLFEFLLDVELLLMRLYTGIKGCHTTPSLPLPRPEHFLRSPQGSPRYIQEAEAKVVDKR